MKIYIIRHAEKCRGGYYNPRLRHQDEPLTPRGREQSEKLVAYFSDRSVARIYVSGYLRTAQTAAPLAQRLGIEPVIDERLNEIDNGLLEGLNDAEVQERYPEVWQAFLSRSADFRFPEGETGEEARSRAASLLEEKRLEGADVILVCHEGLIRLMACHILGLPVYDRWNFHVDYGGIVEIATQETGGRWKLIRFNQVGL
jgi:broad specificity phosphatase PhoE